MKNLAIIPARSGSKGLKDKNIKEIKGIPLMAYSINAALESDIFDCVHVSTDSEIYANIARKYKADVPFLRKKEYAADWSSSREVVLAVLEEYLRLGKEFDMVTLLQPTSPLRDAFEIKEAYKLFQNPGVEAVVSVCESSVNPKWCNYLPEDYNMENFIEKKSVLPRQKLEKYYQLNGAIYMMKTDYVKQNETFIDKGCYAYIMSREKSIDIDEEFDFRVAELLVKNKDDKLC